VPFGLLGRHIVIGIEKAGIHPFANRVGDDEPQRVRERVIAPFKPGTQTKCQNFQPFRIGMVSQGD
jgi:hypothetical protein